MAQDALHGHRGPTAMSGLRGRCGLPRVGGREYGVRGLWVVETSVLGLSCPTASSYPRLRQTGQEQSAPSRRPYGVGPGRHCLGTAPATVVYPTTADNYFAPKPGTMPPTQPVLEGARPWSHTFFTTNSLC